MQVASTHQLVGTDVSYVISSLRILQVTDYIYIKYIMGRFSNTDRGRVNGRPNNY